jgi:membrane peptidoglycan carboxypeptidase
VELGNEAAGIVADPSQTQWQALDLVNRAFGQGVAVTPLQLVRAFAAMANGGILVQPHLYVSDDAAAAASAHQVISPELSDTLRQLMIHVVDEGPNYAAETKIPGYVVGGKTGTAQIWDAEAGGWLADTYNHTFVGFVGNDKPEAIILVRIHDTIPRVPKKWGMSLEVTSNELWRRVALATISALDLPPLTDPGGSPDQPSLPPSADPTTNQGPTETQAPTEVARLPASSATGKP